MLRPLVVLAAIVCAPLANARAQAEMNIDPATLSVLHDPAARQLRIPIVEADLVATDDLLAALPDRAPWHVGLGVGVALAVVGMGAEIVALLGLAGAELGEDLGCGVSTLAMDPCPDSPTPEWILPTAAAGAPTLVAGLIALLISASQLGSIRREEARLRRRRDGRLRELDLLRGLTPYATADSLGVGSRLAF